MDCHMRNPSQRFLTTISADIFRTESGKEGGVLMSVWTLEGLYLGRDRSELLISVFLRERDL